MVFDHKIYEKDKKQAENINDNTEQETTNHILNSIHYSTDINITSFESTTALLFELGRLHHFGVVRSFFGFNL